MEIKINEPILDLGGKEIKEDGIDRVLTTGTVMINSLVASYSEEKADGQEKLKRFQMAMKIQEATGDTISFKSEEVTKIKELVGKAYNTVIVGRLYSSIEGEEEVKE